jgi:mono/diheme cytochrome c family protein
MRRLTPLLLAAAFLAAPGLKASADEASIERGRYLVGIAGCGDCHTPGYFLGKPDMSRHLAVSDVGFEVPQLGTFYGPNLTPDKDTGLGSWNELEIVTAFTKGIRPDGRLLAPTMPWMGYANFTPADAQSIAAYLKSLAPVKNQVPGPFGPGEKATSFVMRVIPPGG